MKIFPPNSSQILINNANRLAGMTLGQLAKIAGLAIPPNPQQAKGWMGQLLEQLLGAEAGSQALPDFVTLGIELKTVPVSADGHPLETTYVTTVNVDELRQQTWETSPVFRKLNRVLWIPIEGDTRIALAARRIGLPVLWSPSPEQATTLEHDWEEIVERILLGELSSITASLGTYLHVRPKAAHGKVLQKTKDYDQTLPRGFYLRTSLTREIMSAGNAAAEQTCDKN